MDYPAPWSRVLIVVSGIASAVLIAIGVLMGWAIREPGLGIAMAVLPPFTLVASLLFLIRGYRLDGAQLYVGRLLWETAVDLRGLESAEVVPISWNKSIRLFGNGGLFSVSGTFWNRDLGRYRAFVTDHTNAVVLRASGRTIVVSPGNPEDFVRDLLQIRPDIRTGKREPEEAAR